MPPSDESKSGPLTAPLESWGALWIRVLELVGGVSYLLLDVVGWLLLGAFSKRVRLGRTAMVTQMVRVGVRSIGIVMLVCGCIGFILALQMQPPLADFGQTDKIANIIGVAIFRELGPLVAAIVLAGFAGASIAAEIGTMVVGEEIEALEAHALNPIRFLVVPRVVATTLSLIMLTVIGDITAVFFGGLMTINFLGVPYELYKANTLEQVVINDFLTGLIKAAVFGVILSAIACYNGLRVTGGAAGVGRATTDTVVQTIVSVIVADLLFTMIFYSLGWT
ncbi:MAG: ABC transporter permease [Phycisphaerales bacterium]|nr:ABC transporter permease [Phycisphaerae bacterium]NNF43987.1 ABC transporter permease [Phycisphaerales bacterium]NNM27791.1 ABC transporter permease [Phycisphaerales bacterium]